MEISYYNSSDIQQKKKTRKRITIEIIIAILIIVPAILLSVNLKKLVLNRIFKAIELKPNSEGYDTWLKPPTTITRGYYLFNITNPIQIMIDPSSTTVHLKETQPYSYLLSSTKQDIEWSKDNKTINYSIYRLFNRHQTQFNLSSINDTGIFVDLLRATFRTQFGSKPTPAFYALGGNNVFYQRNAIEQLEGFTSDLFYVMQDKMTGPNIQKSGFIYRYNGSRTYNFTIKTGLMEKGQVQSFASENVPFSFSSPNYYNFTIYDGLTFIPMLFDKPTMNIFQPDFCRPINVKFNKIISMFGGIHVHEYIIRLVDFDQCEDPQNISTCPELDKLDVSNCISSSLPPNTVFLSKPHFYGSSNETMKEMNIEGFTPTRDKHEALIYFEPYSGTPLRAHHRVQLNIEATIDPMKQSNYETELQPMNKKGVKRLLPLVWIDQEVNVDDATIRTLRMVHLTIRHGPWIIITLAILLVITFIIIMELLAKRAAKNERIKLGGNQRSEPLVKQ